MGRRGSAYVFASVQKPHPVRKAVLWIFLTLVILSLLFLGAGLLTSRSVHFERQYVTIDNLPETLKGFRILHLSDLHGATYGSGQAAIGNALQGVNYHCVVMTGDMLGPNGEDKPLLQLLDQLSLPVPIYYCPGDEDTSYLDSVGHGVATPYSEWAYELTQRGVEILDRPKLITRASGKARIWFIPDGVMTMDLDSETSTLQARRRTIELSGGQDAGLRVADYELARLQEIRASIEDMRDGDIFVLVSHIPLTADTVAMRNEGSTRADLFSTRQASLVLSGHLCAGQFRLPGLGAVSVPGYGSFPEDELITGMTWQAGVQQYISPGLGASSIYPWWAFFRLFNPPVVTQLVLTDSLT